MPQDSFQYAAGRLMVIENRLMNKSSIERMVEAHSPEDVLKILLESDYGIGRETCNPNDYESFLADELAKTYRLIENITPDKRLTDLFLLKYDIHNLKVLIKASYLGNVQNMPLVNLGTLSHGELMDAVKDGEVENLPDFLVDALKDIKDEMESRLDPMKIDVILDRAYYSYAIYLSKRKLNQYLKQLFTINIDLINMRTMLRIKKIGESYDYLNGLLIEGGSLELRLFKELMNTPLEELTRLEIVKDNKYSEILISGINELINEGNLTSYERHMDDYIMTFLKANKHNPDGIEPVIGYLLAKENEIKLVRIIMVGKINNMPTDRIRERLRDVYV